MLQIIYFLINNGIKAGGWSQAGNEKKTSLPQSKYLEFWIIEI